MWCRKLQEPTTQVGGLNHTDISLPVSPNCLPPQTNDSPNQSVSTAYACLFLLEKRIFKTNRVGNWPSTPIPKCLGASLGSAAYLCASWRAATSAGSGHLHCKWGTQLPACPAQPYLCLSNKKTNVPEFTSDISNSIIGCAQSILIPSDIICFRALNTSEWSTSSSCNPSPDTALC